MEELRSWWEVPSIAHFCSLFRAAFGLSDFDIEEFEEALISSGSCDGSPLINDLVFRLLKGCFPRKDVRLENCDKFLFDSLKHRYEEELNLPHPLAKKSFSDLNLRTKVEVLYALCDCRLDVDTVPDVLKGLDADSLRVEPMGSDNSGALYWYFYGTRLYKEEPELSPPLQDGEHKKKKNKDKKKKIKDKKKRKKERDKDKTKKKRDKTCKEKKIKGKKNVNKSDLNQNKNSGNSGSSSHHDKTNRKKQHNKSRPLHHCDVRDDSDAEDVSVRVTEDEDWEDERPSRWSVVCSTEQDWIDLADSFKKSKYRCERELYRTLTEDFLPEIPKMIEAKERERRKKLMELAPRRSSGRLQEKRQVREETQLLDSAVEDGSSGQNSDVAENVKMEEDEATRRKMLAAKEAREIRAMKREERLHLIAQGVDPTGFHDTDQSEARSGKRKCESGLDEDVVGAMMKVLNVVKNHDDAWPFAEPVQESYAPNYYSIVKKPMDLSSMEQRVKSGHYHSQQQFCADFSLILENCSLYNGPDSEYTEMSQKVERCFNRAFRKFMPVESDSDEDYVVKTSPDEQSHLANNIRRPQRLASSRAIAAIHWNNEDMIDSSSSGDESPVARSVQESENDQKSKGIKTEQSLTSSENSKSFRHFVPASIKTEPAQHQHPSSNHSNTMNSQSTGGASVPSEPQQSSSADAMHIQPQKGIHVQGQPSITQTDSQGAALWGVAGPRSNLPSARPQGKIVSPQVISNRHAFPNLMRAAAAATAASNAASTSHQSTVKYRMLHQGGTPTHTPPGTPPPQGQYRVIAPKPASSVPSNFSSLKIMAHVTDGSEELVNGTRWQHRSSPNKHSTSKSNSVPQGSDRSVAVVSQQERTPINTPPGTPPPQGQFRTIQSSSSRSNSPALQHSHPNNDNYGRMNENTEKNSISSDTVKTEAGHELAATHAKCESNTQDHQSSNAPNGNETGQHQADQKTEGVVTDKPPLLEAGINNHLNKHLDLSKGSSCASSLETQVVQKSRVRVADTGSPRMMGMHHNLPRVITGSPYRAGQTRVARASSPASLKKPRPVVPIMSTQSNLLSHSTIATTTIATSQSVTMATISPFNVKSHQANSSLPNVNNADDSNHAHSSVTMVTGQVTPVTTETYHNSSRAVTSMSDLQPSHLTHLENMMNRAGSPRSLTGGQQVKTTGFNSHHNLCDNKIQEDSSSKVSRGESRSKSQIDSSEVGRFCVNGGKDRVCDDSHRTSQNEQNNSEIPSSHDVATMLLNFSQGGQPLRSFQGHHAQNDSVKSEAAAVSSGSFRPNDAKTSDQISASSNINDASKSSAFAKVKLNRGGGGETFTTSSEPGDQESMHSTHNAHLPQNNQCQVKQSTKKRKAKEYPDDHDSQVTTKLTRLHEQKEGRRQKSAMLDQSSDQVIRKSMNSHEKRDSGAHFSTDMVSFAGKTQSHSDKEIYQKEFSHGEKGQYLSSQSDTSLRPRALNTQNQSEHVKPQASGTESQSAQAKAQSLYNDNQSAQVKAQGLYTDNQSVHIKPQGGHMGPRAGHNDIQHGETRPNSGHSESQSGYSKTLHVSDLDQHYLHSNHQSFTAVQATTSDNARFNHMHNNCKSVTSDNAGNSSSQSRSGDTNSFTHSEAVLRSESSYDSQSVHPFHATSRQQSGTSFIHTPSPVTPAGFVRSNSPLPASQLGNRKDVGHSSPAAKNRTEKSMKPHQMNNNQAMTSKKVSSSRNGSPSNHQVASNGIQNQNVPPSNQDKSEARQTLSPKHILDSMNGTLHSNPMSHASLSSRHMLGLDTAHQFHPATMPLGGAGFSQPPHPHSAHLQALSHQQIYPIMSAGQPAYMGGHPQAMGMPASAGYMMGMPGGMSPDPAFYQQYIQLQQRMQEEQLLIQQHQMMSKQLPHSLMQQQFGAGAPLMQSPGYPSQQTNPYANHLQPPSFPR